MISPEPFTGPPAEHLPEPLPEDGPDLGQEPRTVRCRLCGRPLTGTASRRTGLGPACDAKLHPARPDIPTRRREADQETLPGI